jgi:hypothetical protein
MANVVKGISDAKHGAVNSPKNVRGEPRSSFDEQHSMFVFFNIATNVRGQFLHPRFSQQPSLAGP